MDSFLTKIGKSIISGDVYILIVACSTLALFIVVQKIAKQVEEEVKLYHSDPSRRFAEDLAKRLNSYYNLFTTAITVFPLLGMLGTVSALIEINLSGETEAFRQNFFDALTSTAWGIIFAIIFKFCNAKIEYNVMRQIEAAEKILDEELTSTLKNGEPSHEK